MNIKWKNIFGLIAMITSVYLILHLPKFLRIFADSMWPVFTPYDPVWQFFKLALICLTILAAVVIISRR